jgi:hypothetical protein
MGGFTIWGKYSEKHELFQNFVAEEEYAIPYLFFLKLIINY